MLHTSALAGLAAKLDFTTVKLRKTGIVEQMMADQEGKVVEDGLHKVTPHSDVNSTYGVKLTTHPMMLLQVKGVLVYTCNTTGVYVLACTCTCTLFV